LAFKTPTRTSLHGEAENIGQPKLTIPTTPWLNDQKCLEELFLQWAQAELFELSFINQIVSMQGTVIFLRMNFQYTLAASSIILLHQLHT